jgi:hypothetical protein
MSTNIIVEGATGSKSKEGVIQWVVPYYVQNIAQVKTAGKGAYEGCQEVSRTWACNNDGTDPSYIVTVTYEGGSSESVSATYGDEESTVWSLDFEMAEEPIEAHWNFEEIKKKYGWEVIDGVGGFPEKLPAGSGESSGLSSNKSGGGAKSPMFGKKTFIEMNCIASVSYTKRTLPGSVIGNIGKSSSNIPGAPSDFNGLDKGERNWIKMPPQISKRGNVWQISESWKLSEYYKWPKEVYPDGNAGNLS